MNKQIDDYLIINFFPDNFNNDYELPINVNKIKTPVYRKKI
jgi:hypothetical protein